MDGILVAAKRIAEVVGGDGTWHFEERFGDGMMEYRRDGPE
jgi:hypothetical protein